MFATYIYMPYIPVHISLLFIALVFVIAVFYIVTIHHYSKRAQLSDRERTINVAASIFVILGWLIFTLIVAQTGFLTDFQSRPAHIVYVVIPPFIVVTALAFSKRFMRVAGLIDQFWLIYPQSFRIVMEVILLLLYRYAVIPRQMTLEGGYNFDVLAGITAPFVAYYCFRKKTWSPKVALVWNIAGLILLLNIMVISFLSTPYHSRYFMNEPANLIPFYFPFVWLPTFVAPFAFFLHLLSIKRLLSPKTDYLKV